MKIVFVFYLLKMQTNTVLFLGPWRFCIDGMKIRIGVVDFLLVLILKCVQYLDV